MEICWVLVILMSTTASSIEASNSYNIRDEVFNYLQDKDTRWLLQLLSSVGTTDRDLFHLDEKDIQRLKFILRPVDMTESYLARFVLDADYIDEGAWEAETLMEELMYPSQDTVTHIREALVDLLRDGEYYSQGESEVLSNSESSSGYEQCRMDYTSLMGPLSDRFLFILHVIYDVYCVLNIPACWNGPDIPERPSEPSTRNLSTWGRQALDALAKLPTGLAEGKLHWPGSFEYCESMEAEYEYWNTTYLDPGHPISNRTFRGQYCRLDLQRGGSLTLQFGACVPSTCAGDDIYRYVMEDDPGLKLLMTLLGFNITGAYCGQELDASTDAELIVTIVISGIIAVLVILATIYDGLLRQRYLQQHLRPVADSNPPEHNQEVKSGSVQVLAVDAGGKTPPPGYCEVDPSDRKRYSLQSGPEFEGITTFPHLTTQVSNVSTNPLVSSEDTSQEYEPTLWDRLEVAFVGFSVWSNLKRIFRVDPEPKALCVLDALRVLSFCWVVLGHTYLFGPVYAECFTTANLLTAVRELPKKWDFQHIVNFHYASDTFFVISGTLTSFWWLQYHSTKPLSRWGIPYYILHRYWRIMPTYMLVLMFYTCTYRYLLHGPLSPVDIQDAENCKINWWTNMLMVMNLVNTDKQCIAWTWYFSVLMQLHIVALVVLVPLVLLPWLGGAMLALLYITHIGATAGVTASIYDGNRLQNFSSWYDEYFITPWCRGGPYLIGLAVGILLQKTNAKIKIKLWLALILWIIALGCLAIPVYVTYDQLGEGGGHWTDSAFVAYDTLCRSVWALGVAWVIVACAAGYGGFVTSILTVPVWQPLSKLVFCAYIPHAMMLYKNTYGQFTLVYIDPDYFTVKLFGNMVLVYIVGLVVAVLFHYPIAIGLERALLCKTRDDVIKCGNHPNDAHVTSQEAHQKEAMAEASTANGGNKWLAESSKAGELESVSGSIKKRIVNTTPL